MGCFYVIGLRVNHRHANAVALQEMLTKFGCHIRMRVGLHETNEQYCSDDGIILLQVCAEKETVDAMMTELNAAEGITAKLMDLNETDE